MFDTVGIIAVIDNTRVLGASQSALKEDDRKQTYVAHVSKGQQITRSMNLDVCITVLQRQRIGFQVTWVRLSIPISLMKLVVNIDVLYVRALDFWKPSMHVENMEN